ncbi:MULTISPECIES: PP2C family protein-serine/threonine phosphatase [unclassified Streptomyces]|uniref:PP2C family protein-serine/threonine phosphatase n=1 Tax=unclassified Streptomyces TaxID=2593676 RepID=UPI002DDA31AB|nr:SpoIIE family protein phosphatase [Streptomyces sp. NBC_01257]WRZ62926.1 SpoIIE family protein phosphatase [Streptomyces sp. NBC_01257]WSU56894.1 SpoIIE family protein phosphatase [Streptomyces sp. NBC_01104]
MPPHLSADRPAPQPPERDAGDAVDALISRTRRLRGDVDAVRRDTVLVDEDDPQLRWQRALCDLAVHQLDDLGAHLGQLKEGLSPEAAEQLAARTAPLTGQEPIADEQPGSLIGRVGSAEWNLLTDEVTWSDELFQIFGRTAEAGPLSLDDLPAVLLPEDQPLLTALVTDCLVDGKPIDGEFRILRPDGRMRSLHMMGEPVLDADGCTASMWAVLRDVSALHRSRQTVRRTQESARRQQDIARAERRMAMDLQEAVLPPWRGSLRLPDQGPGALDIAAHYLPSESSALIGGGWYDAMELPDGRTLLTVGDLTGHGIQATSAMAMILGALRGMAVAGIEPGALMGHLNQLLETSIQPALGSAVCCRFDPATRRLDWAQAGHPAPLLFRDGAGRPVPPPDGVLLGAASGVTYEQEELHLLPGDVLVLHTDGLARDNGNTRNGLRPGTETLLGLAPRFAEARTAQECVRTVVEEFGGTERLDDACVLIARIGA